MCTPIGLGCAPLGELFVRVDDATATATLEAAWSEGIRYFDTAPEYGLGLSEHRVGHFLRVKPRGEFLLSTKVGRLLHTPRDLAKYKKTFWTGGLDFDYRFDYGYDAIMRSVEDSYQRLGLNRVDVLLIHDLDVFTHGSQLQVDAYLNQLLTGGWRALAQLRADGMIGAIGAGLNDAGMMMTLMQATDLDFFLLAMRYTLMEQDTLDIELAECASRGVGVVVGGVFNSGITATGAFPTPTTITRQPPNRCWSAAQDRGGMRTLRRAVASGGPAVPAGSQFGGCGHSRRRQPGSGGEQPAEHAPPDPSGLLDRVESRGTSSGKMHRRLRNLEVRKGPRRSLTLIESGHSLPIVSQHRLRRN